MLSLETRFWCGAFVGRCAKRYAILAGMLFLPVLLVMPDSAVAQTRSLNGVYTETFDSLANSGSPTWTNDSTLDGWQAFRASGGPLFTAYVANTGSSTTGTLYSYGATATTDRALGSLASGTTGTITLGVAFTNNTGSTLQSLNITYSGEQWRSGTATGEGYVFEYQIGVSSADALGTWIAVPQLNFVAPQNTGAGALDGNLAANRATLSFTLSGLSIPAGTDFCLRWRDNDASGSDHGIGLDDFSLGFSPTAITLAAFQAIAYADGIRLEWKTGYEVNNLGFRIWRVEGENRTLVNRQLIAGSAFTAGLHPALLAGENYVWWDSRAIKNASYWLEDLDLSGTSTWHGPFYARQHDELEARPDRFQQARTLAQITGNDSQIDTSHVVEERVVQTIDARRSDTLTTNPEWHSKLVSAGLESRPAIKLSVKGEGIYRVFAAQLFAAGLSRDTDADKLQLITDGQEIPLRLASENGRLSDRSFIEFYGLGLDTAATDTRVYWLIEGKRPGLRMRSVAPPGRASTAQSFTRTVERRDRIIYFSGLTNGDEANFFGDLIYSEPLDQILSLSNLYQQATQPASVLVTLQGVTRQPHRVAVQLNNCALGVVEFSGQEQGIAKFVIPHALLVEGPNTVRLSALGGANDISLVDRIRIGYEHRFAADNNGLKFTVPAHQQVTVTGFMTADIRVFDVTNAQAPVELVGSVQPIATGYAVTLTGDGSGERNLLAISAEQSVAAIKTDQPSDLKQARGADFVVISARQFFTALEPLGEARRQTGHQVAMVDIEDIYDEFNFGNKSAGAIRDFLRFARVKWQTPPRAVLFVGDATYDPRGFIGGAEFDLVPTKFVNTALMETASDDWFSDFDDDGIADLATGRLPVRTPDEAELIIGKILRAGQAQTPAKALLIADQNQGFDFEAASTQLHSVLESTLQVEEIHRGQIGTASAKTQLFEALQDGRRFINYAGHASVGLWRDNLLTTDEARTLHNQTLPMFVMMACLNGYFVDLSSESLAESLLNAEAGGAVSVWASSGLCLPEQQTQLAREFYRSVLADKVTLGEAARRAKLAITDSDLRKTWVLFGDPTCEIK